MRTRLLALSAALLLAMTLASCSDDEPSSTTGTEAETVECDYTESGMPAAKDVDPPSSSAVAEGEIPVTLETSVGDFELSLDAERTPCTAHSFESLVEQGWFDGTTCHRLVTQGIFVLQCGDPTGTGTGGPGYSFDDELDGEESYTAGALAMANSGANTNGSQFFIVFADSTGLPKDYTVFGSVDDATVTAIEEVAADGTATGSDGPPNTPVDISSATVGD